MSESFSSEQLGRLKRLFQHLAVNDGDAIRKIVDALELTDAARYARHFSGHWDERASEPDDALSLCLCGWRDYYRAHYVEAGRWFAQAWGHRSEWASWSALGQGKVCSDLGCWDEALRWLLTALNISRQENDFYRMAEAYGALGEVFCRSGDSVRAYEMFYTDARLLPPGSGHHHRLNNYMAICLGRLGCPELARPILWESYYGARDSDPVSATFSLASLFTLSVHTQNEDLFRRLHPLEPHSAIGAAAMPRAFIECSRAYWAWRKADLVETERRCAAAVEFLGELYPVEHFWVSRLKAAASGGTLGPDALRCLQRRPHPVFTADDRPFSILDDHLLVEPLSPCSPPFAELETAQDTEHLWSLMRLFFI